MKIGGTVKALLVLFVVLSCTTQDDPASIGLLADSASYDLLKYNFLAYHQTHDEVTVVDQIYPDLDTIRLDNKSIRLFKTYGPPDEEFEVVGAHFLLVKECDSIMCKLSIHNARGDSIGQGYLPLKATARLINPQMDFEKRSFYNRQDQLIRKYNKMIQRKYNLTDRQFDSLLYTNVDKIRLEVEKQ